MMTFGRDANKLVTDARMNLQTGDNQMVFALVNEDPPDFAAIIVTQHRSSPLLTCGPDVDEHNGIRWNIERVDETRYGLTKDSVQREALQILAKYKEIGLTKQVAQAIIAKIMA